MAGFSVVSLMDSGTGTAVGAPALGTIEMSRGLLSCNSFFMASTGVSPAEESEADVLASLLARLLSSLGTRTYGKTNQIVGSINSWYSAIN